MKHRLVILDRDGVINEERGDYIRSPDQWQPIPGSLQAIARLCKAGLSVAVATNQSGVGRGLITRRNLAATHDKLQLAVRGAGGELAGIFYCPHTPADRCTCRKPLPGLLQQIEQTLDIPVAGEYMVGDSMRDLQAAIAAGALPVLVRTGFGAHTEHQPGAERAVEVFDRLGDFADWLLGDA